MIDAMPVVDWSNDFYWLGYQIGNNGPVPPPHTWQDWIVTFLYVAVLVGATWGVVRMRKQFFG